MGQGSSEDEEEHLMMSEVLMVSMIIMLLHLCEILVKLFDATVCIL